MKGYSITLHGSEGFQAIVFSENEYATALNTAQLLKQFLAIELGVDTIPVHLWEEHFDEKGKLIHEEWILL